MKSGLVFFARFAALCFWHLMSLMIAALVVGIFASLAHPGQAAVGFAPLLAVSVLEVAVVMWLISYSNLAGIKLLLVMFIVFHGVKIFLMMIELAFFLNIWATPPMISLERVFALELHGLLMALLFCPVAILMLKKWKAIGQNLSSVFPAFNRDLIIRVFVVGVLYSVCYWIAGSFLLIPLAGESFIFTYGHLQLPVWMPLFQVGRGILWALIVLLLVRHLRLEGIALYLGVGSTLAILGGAQLLVPNPYMLDHLRYAHMVEIAVSMGVFGSIASWILRSEQVALVRMK